MSIFFKANFPHYQRNLNPRFALNLITKQLQFVLNNRIMVLINTDVLVCNI